MPQNEAVLQVSDGSNFQTYAAVPAFDEALPHSKQLLVLHFDVDVGLINHTSIAHSTTTGEMSVCSIAVAKYINRMLCDFAWGHMSQRNGSWLLESAAPTALPPPEAGAFRGLAMTYRQYLREFFKKDYEGNPAAKEPTSAEDIDLQQATSQLDFSNRIEHEKGEQVASSTSLEQIPMKSENAQAYETKQPQHEVLSEMEAMTDPAIALAENFTEPTYAGSTWRHFFMRIFSNIIIPAQPTKTSAAHAPTHTEILPLTFPKSLSILFPSDTQSDKKDIKEYKKHFSKGYWRILPCFWKLLATLVRWGLNFKLFLHTNYAPDDPELLGFIEEYNLFAEGLHPAFSYIEQEYFKNEATISKTAFKPLYLHPDQIVKLSGTSDSPQLKCSENIDAIRDIRKIYDALLKGGKDSKVMCVSREMKQQSEESHASAPFVLFVDTSDLSTFHLGIQGGLLSEQGATLYKRSMDVVDVTIPKVAYRNYALTAFSNNKKEGIFAFSPYPIHCVTKTFRILSLEPFCTVIDDNYICSIVEEIVKNQFSHLVEGDFSLPAANGEKQWSLHNHTPATNSGYAIPNAQPATNTALSPDIRSIHLLIEESLENAGVASHSNEDMPQGEYYATRQQQTISSRRYAYKPAYFPQPIEAPDTTGSETENLSHKQYLLKYLVPALLPALKKVTNERPKYPLLEMAFHILGNMDQEDCFHTKHKREV